MSTKNAAPTASSLARHFAWKERCRKEQNSVYTSLGKCVSLGILKNLPLKDEEIDDLTPTSKANPYKLLQKLKDSQNDNHASPIAATSTIEHSPEKTLGNRKYSMENINEHKELVLPNIKNRLSSNETVPYSEYIIGAQSSIKKEAPLLNFRTSDGYYKPQKKQFQGNEKLNYMVGTINLKQPTFTYLPLEQQSKQKITFMPTKPKADEMFYSSKYGVHLRKSCTNLETISPYKLSPQLKSSLKASLAKVQLGAEDDKKGQPITPNKNGDCCQEVYSPSKAPDLTCLGPKIMRNPSKLMKKSRISSNGLYTTQTIGSALDLKQKQKMAKEIIKTRKQRQSL